MPDDSWTGRGIYKTEAAASKAAEKDDFIACVRVGEPFPDSAVNAIKLYYPKKETWKTSALYKMRNPAHILGKRECGLVMASRALG